MGRKSKPPVKLDLSSGSTEVPPQDGLPPFKRFIDIDGERHGQKTLTRLFFMSPTDEEVADTLRSRESNKLRVFVIGARMPYMNGVKASPPLFDHCSALGFSDAFATDVVRLAISHLHGKHLSKNSVKRAERALREFFEILATHSKKPQAITDVSKENWTDYLARCVADGGLDAEDRFNAVRLIFNGYPPTSNCGWLAGIKFRAGKRRKTSQEHTSELAETRDYSDGVMYQLLSLFIYTFEQRIGYLKRYQALTEEDMPQDWIYPGRKADRSKKRGTPTDTFQLLRTWLCDEDAGYQTLIDHYILHHKAGSIGTTRRASKTHGITGMLNGLAKYSQTIRALVSKFNQEMARRHGYDYKKDGVSLIHFYAKKNALKDTNPVINQIGWCLANLLMMQTGANKEVVLTIPSKAEDGKSILNRGDTVFVKSGGADTEVNLYGIKAKTGASPRKIIPITLAKNSPLYEMLVEYERYVKVGDGPFFEFNQSLNGDWSTAGVSDLSKLYPVIDENGEQLTSIDSTRFRKVFASGQLLDRMKGIKDMNELAEKLRDDLSHGSLDTTLTNYLLKSTAARSVIDIAIATITGGKLNDLKSRSQIELQKPIPYKKKTFLCHCVDPHNPSHDVSIADECRHYDLCLGCEQSTITKEHLPYICMRIIQYENERKYDPYTWTATFEDRWCIAHDALDRYVSTDKRNGWRLVNEAWVSAREGRISLPPIIAATKL